MNAKNKVTMGRPPAAGSLLDLAHKNGIMTSVIVDHWQISISQVHRINKNPKQWHWDSIRWLINPDQDVKDD